MADMETQDLEEEEIRRPMSEKDLQIIANFRLMDDNFFSEVLDGKKEAVEYILNTVLERTDLKVISTKAQVEYHSAMKRSVRLDIYAIDAEGEVMDVEIQRSDEGSGERRARFHSSMIDRNLLEKGDKFEKLVDTYVIFITEDDPFKMGIPLYHINRHIEEKGHTLFDDGAHIIYVNGNFRDTSHPVGRLMQDFNCKNAEDIRNPLLATEVRYYKKTERGQRHMCRMIQQEREEAAVLAAEKATAEAEQNTLLNAIRNLMQNMQWTAEKAMEALDVPAADQSKYMAQL